GRTQNVGGTDFRRVDLTFPYGFLFVRNASGGGVSGAAAEAQAGAAAGASARAALLGEILTAFGTDLTGLQPTPANLPSVRRFTVSQNHPNPFNPSTTIAFTAPERGRVTVEVFDLRGVRLRMLLDAEVDAGSHEVRWDGRDAAGKSVASGVYFYRVTGFGQWEVRKLALVR
ncbi:MAG: FlgD immunoglobulin-like domain containing protein, partial [Acidobacteriota bacterium]